MRRMAKKLKSNDIFLNLNWPLLIRFAGFRLKSYNGYFFNDSFTPTDPSTPTTTYTLPHHSTPTSNSTGRELKNIQPLSGGEKEIKEPSAPEGNSHLPRFFFPSISPPAP
ncbi:hypothetical protein EVAR_61941_1 [Eumeta japonica]|uniref:Uncharacterized protein n=1 Tax=Eumeta variegata TaxID=151549 RepID=A0A4C1ZKP3_EUMVA|nr:hypothetical protein EVAR_61941_1 [Eumeta japonica]